MKGKLGAAQHLFLEWHCAPWKTPARDEPQNIPSFVLHSRSSCRMLHIISAPPKLETQHTLQNIPSESNTGNPRVMCCSDTWTDSHSGSVTLFLVGIVIPRPNSSPSKLPAVPDCTLLVIQGDSVVSLIPTSPKSAQYSPKHCYNSPICWTRKKQPSCYLQWEQGDIGSRFSKIGNFTQLIVIHFP